MIYNNILEAVGHTPMVQLNRMTGPEDARVLVKFEGLNVGGSIKTRTALNMIEDAEKRGWLKPDSIIVEPTSGNQGIGLALIGAVRFVTTAIVLFAGGTALGDFLSMSFGMATGFGLAYYLIGIVQLTVYLAMIVGGLWLAKWLKRKYHV